MVDIQYEKIYRKKLRQRFAILIYLGNRIENDVAASLEDHSSHDDLIENIIDTVIMVNDVKLANVLEAAVENMHKHLEKVEDS